MIGLPLQQDSRVRSNRARFLALFLFFSVMSHGLYYPQEWLVFGFALSLYAIPSYWFGTFKARTASSLRLGLTDLFMLGMTLFSILGVVHPVKIADGLLEALQWGIFWVIYRLGMHISSDEIARKRLFDYIEWLAIGVAIIGWLPWVGMVAGRLSSVFGYPNTLAAFLGAVLLLNPQRKLVRFLLVASLLATGSRAGVGLFVIILIGEQLILLRQEAPTRNIKLRSRVNLRGLWLVVLGVSGFVLVMLYNEAAWENLTTWGLSSSSWQERWVYFKDGIRLAWNAGGLPQAGGWLAFPTVQHFPYWADDPHSSFIHILLSQGIIGVVWVGIWGGLVLAQVWKSSGKKRRFHIGVGDQEDKVEVRVWAALLFLALHSLVDADFSFGSLGCLFWLLFGSIQKVETHSRSPNTLRLSNKAMMVFCSLLCFICGSLLINPAFIEKERIWNAYAIQWREQDSEKSIEFWDKSLTWDQTQSITRQRQAEYLLRHGEIAPGLQAVEEVLKWQPYNLKAYEWAQSVVWNTAEVQRRTQPETAKMLYHWVEAVPKSIEERVKGLSLSERLLWQGYRDFSPSPHIILLAEYARQRQLTQPLSIT